MSSISNLYTVPEGRPVPGPILHILAVVHRVATGQKCPYVVVGATARDLLLFHVFGIPASRATRDVDFAIAVESWDKFNKMRDALLATKEFSASRAVHRLHLAGTNIPIDLIPFGGVAEDHTIAWPPSRDTVMTVAGFEDAIAASIKIQVSPDLTVPVVSLAALTVLKVFAWEDRKTSDKDALDLYRVISTYADAGNEDRLYAPAMPYLEKFGHNVGLAGAALAGEDSRLLSSAAVLIKLRTLVSAESFMDTLAERIRTSQWPFEPEKLSDVRAMLTAYFDELTKGALFISHATPEDNAFTIWLGAKLAAAGYEVWADVFQLKGGDDWQRKLEDGLRNRACKFLLVANQKSVAKQGVRNEIQIASEVARKIGDTKFIIPLRLGNFDAPFLIAHAQYIDFSRSWSAGLHELLSVLQDEYKVPTINKPSTEVWSSLQAIYSRKLEQRSERLVSNWLHVRKLPEKIFYYRNTELRNNGVTLTLPAVPYGDGFLTCEEHAIEGATKTLLGHALGVGWPELGILNTDLRKIFAQLANQGMELFLKSKGLQPFEMANGRLAWWFGGELPDTRLPFRWGDLKGSRVLRGASEKRKVQWHFGITSQYRGGSICYFRLRTHLLFSEDGKTALTGKRIHRMRRSFAKGWRNARWRDMLLTLLFWLSDGESMIRLPLHLDDDLVAEVPPLMFVSPVGMSEGEEEEIDEEEGSEEFTEEYDESDFDEEA